jgi:uncharacterized protein
MSGTRIGTIAEIYRYPVKSMGGERLATALVTPRGLQWDRGYALYDPVERKVASASSVKRFPGLLDFSARYDTGESADAALPPVQITLPDGSVASTEDDCAAALSKWFGTPTAISAIVEEPATRPKAGRYAMEDTYFDYAPLHLLTDTALASLAARSPGSVIAAQRFRPNLLIESLVVGEFPENAWTGCRLRLGKEVIIEVTDPCPRCAMPTLAQGQLPGDPSILKNIATSNTVHTPVLDSDQPCLGAYAFVFQGGVVSQGDEVRME